jgi:DNA-binding IclR family transcriptional regulator
MENEDFCRLPPSFAVLQEVSAAGFRICNHLARLSRKQRVVQMTQAELAEVAVVSRSHVNRVLKQLQVLGLIEQVSNGGAAPCSYALTDRAIEVLQIDPKNIAPAHR